MNAHVRKLLDSFDDLSEADQYEVTIEIFRRTAAATTDALPDESHVAAADVIFRRLERQEAGDARS